MWHEARKQERKIKVLLVDYRRRAERRQDFYERIKADPTQFLQIHGRKCKIHLDTTIAAAAENPAIMMPWLGQKDNMIDRFDVRAHLDHIPPIQKPTIAPGIEMEDDMEERLINYERYRVLSQNDFLSIQEEKFLHQLHLEEQFGVNAQIEIEKSKNKKPSGGGVAIGYSYDDCDSPSINTTPFSQQISAIESAAPTKFDECIKDDSDSDLDMDVSIDINKVGTTQAHEMNACGRHYGMKLNDFYSFLTKDADEADALKMAREEEQEKIMLSGRKSRRERRAQRERRFAGRPLSPPSYAAKEIVDPKSLEKFEEDEESRSPSPVNSGKITYITSFGGEEELQPHSKISINFNSKLLNNSIASTSIVGLGALTYAEKVKQNLEKLKKINDHEFQRSVSSSSRSRSRSRVGRGSRKSRSLSRSPRYSRGRRKSPRSRTRSKSNTRSKTKSVSRKRSRSRKYSSSSSSSKSSSSSSSAASRRKRYSRKASSSSSSRSRSIPKAGARRRRSTSSSSSSSSSSSCTSMLRKKPIVEPVKVKSVSPPIQKVAAKIKLEHQEPLPEPLIPIKKYYGRKRDGESSSEDLSVDEEEDRNQDNKTSNNLLSNNTDKKIIAPNNSTSSSRFGKTTANSAEIKDQQPLNLKANNPRDRLKRKMQILLNKQYKADKKAEIEKTERQIQQQQEREDEMRELALKLRKRHREQRHKCGSPNSDNSYTDDEKDDSESPKNRDSLDRDNTRNVSRHSSKKISKTKSRTRSRSRSRVRNRRSRSNSRDRYYNDRDRERDRNKSRYSRERSRDRYHSNRRRHSRSNSRNSHSYSRRYRSKSPRYNHRERNKRSPPPPTPSSTRGKLVDY